MSKEIDVAERYDLQYQIVTRKLKGLNETQIAKDLNIKRNVVLEHLGEWREIAKNDDEIKDRAREALLAMDNHYALIVKEFWGLVEQADFANDLKTKATALKSLADIEAKRVDLLQKAGILDDSVLGDEIAKSEERMEKLKDILKEVTSQCNHCRTEVARRLRNAFGTNDSAVVVPQEDAQSY